MNTTKEKLNKAYNSSKQHFNEHFKDPWSTHKKKISTVWLIGNAFLFPFFISATFACGALEQNNSGQAGFVLIWTFLNSFLLFIGGTMVLFKYHTEYFLGALTASCILMCSWMLQEAIVLGHFSDASSGVQDFGAVSASLIFGIILFLAYLIVAILLVMYQKQILSNTGFQNLEDGDSTAGDTNQNYNNNVSGNIATSTAVVEDEDGNISI
tara:strand:+ start:14 stop:646 length:633 start_codon:yes stop_codon:yes gene_type:complete